MSTYSVFEARNSLSKLIAESRAGAEVVIANRGEPVVKLVPIDGGEPLTSGADVAGWLTAHRLPPRLMRTAAQLDEQIADSREAWE